MKRPFGKNLLLSKTNMATTASYRYEPKEHPITTTMIK